MTVNRALEEAKENKEKGTSGEVAVSSYWGITRPEITREDGTKWNRNCFTEKDVCILCGLVVLQLRTSDGRELVCR
ncbi:hypothetical protein SAY87_027479 [Trapa incisa]|uniref:Uncharacterized protein n=1 Tax=Trapa incisa TaxID=236973 RepID=A0AAN7H0X1_9MYRT|nr:hypothetical protein SAY87_027479 [Trapa incisa]